MSDRIPSRTKSQQNHRFRRWYQRHREEHTRRLRELYAEDEQRREYFLQKDRKRYREKRDIRVRQISKAQQKRKKPHMLTIGIVSQSTGLSVEQLRRIEHAGVLSVERTEGNWRKYSPKQIIALIHALERSSIKIGSKVHIPDMDKLRFLVQSFGGSGYE